MSSLTLYSLSAELVALLDSVDLCENEEQRAECEAEIRRTMEAQIRKVDDFCHFLSHIESQAELATKEIERLKARKASFINLSERLERYAIAIMKSLDLKRLDGNTARMALRANQPAVEIDSEESIPARYKTIRQQIYIDKLAVKRAISSGEEVPGAHLREGSVSLIRS